ncbi:hypothetical protein ABFS82_08G188200 [Erythranthe guttata]|uniref:Uncharacterized protein n=1 Tax=Erythranthe guttata TaxID=4155 RepID=A0A022QFI3_ERYGU|nr:PREDICTED: uncharacterized protein LOC105970461 isoform X1 [Erythranthe guttata]EYU26354.1 hypothetical protein MIMGU_mgv1a011637mg [Erythranthe guttata]|eukprot:XP_012850741.1 PREDICTED: uncharacterized protein LOC105970461 isoform X1 [Erythranthe guttata]
MMHTQPVLRRRLSSANFLLPSASPVPFSHYLNFPFRPTNHYSLCSAHKAWIAQLSEELATTAAAAAASSASSPPPNDGPIELSPSIRSIISAAYGSSSLQTAASVLLTGAFALFLFRSLRRRAKLAKQARLRSSGAKTGSNNSLRKKGKSRTSPDQAFLGAVIAAACGILLYKFTTTIEYSLNHQTLSNNYSVRQITITIRTIINGMCYLATFVFGFNSLGLFLYSGQLALNSFSEVSRSEGDAPLNSSYPKSSDPDSSGTTSADEDQSSDKTQK